MANASLHVLVLLYLHSTAKFPGLAVGSGDHSIRYGRIKPPTYSGREGVGEDMGKGSPGSSHLTVPNRGTCDMYKDGIQSTVKQIPWYIMILVLLVTSTYIRPHSCEPDQCER